GVRLFERLVGIFAAALALERIAAGHDRAAQIASLARGATELVEAAEVRLELVIGDAPVLNRHVVRDRLPAVTRQRLALEHEVARQEAPVVAGPVHAGAADALARRERAPAPHRQGALVREMAEGDGLE